MMFFSPLRDEKLAIVFAWIQKIAMPSDVIEVRGEKSTFFAFKFPVTTKSLPRKVSQLGSKVVTFLIFLNKPPTTFDTGEWIEIFNTEAISVFERKGRNNSMLPIRYGLLQEEKKVLGDFLLQDATQYLKGDARIVTKDFPFERIMRTKVDVGVSLWIGGRLRGSQIVFGDFLLDGAIKACRRSLYDRRFKPVDTKEIKDITLEITLLGDLKIPLSQEEIEKDIIYFEKAYALQDNQRMAWFLPEVFNVRKYASLQFFLQDLAKEKLGRVNSLDLGSIFICEVQDFVIAQSTLTTLYASMPYMKVDKVSLLKNKYKEVAHSAARQLMNLQELDGNIPPIERFSSTEKSHVDWPRLAFSTFALATFGKVMKQDVYSETAKKSLEFIKKYIFLDHFAMQHKLLVLAYLGQASTVLDNKSDEAIIYHKTSDVLANLKFVERVDIISLSQVVSFLKGVVSLSPQISPVIDHIQAYLKRMYMTERYKSSFDFAEWAEAMNSFSDSEKEIVEDFLLRIEQCQKRDGSFQVSPESPFSNTRSSGKLFEILTLHKKETAASLEKVLTYLLSMQYVGTEYFIVSEKRISLRGLFRHDYGNADAWIDSAGHFLLGVSRLLEKK